MGLVEIDASNWPIGLHSRAIEWCVKTIGIAAFGDKWSFDYRAYTICISKKYLPFFIIWITNEKP